MILNEKKNSENYNISCFECDIDILEITIESI